MTTKDYWAEIIKITEKYDPEIHFEGELIDYLADLYPEENKIAVQEEKENEGQYDEDSNSLTSYGPLINHILKDDVSFGKLLGEIEMFFTSRGIGTDQVDKFGFNTDTDSMTPRELALERVKANGWNLQELDQEFKKDPSIVMAAIKQAHGLVFEHADQSLKNDRKFVSEILKLFNGGSAIKFADDTIKNDREFVLEAVKSSGGGIMYDFIDGFLFNEKFMKDKEIILEGVKNDGSLLEYVDESLKKDKEVVLAAVKFDGDALEYADDSLKNDPEILENCRDPLADL